MHNCSQAVSQHRAAMGKSATSITSFVSAQAAMTTCRKLQKPPFGRGASTRNLGLTCQDTVAWTAQICTSPTLTTAEALCNRHVSDMPGSTRRPKPKRTGSEGLPPRRGGMISNRPELKVCQGAAEKFRARDSVNTGTWGDKRGRGCL